MSCEKFEQELFESFGTTFLSEDLQAHITTCVSCKEIFENLFKASSEIGTDELFYELDEIVAQRVEAVNRTIDELEVSKVIETKGRWKTFVPMAAALFLVLGVGLISKVLLQFDSSDRQADNVMIESPLVALTDDDTQSLTEIEFSEFVDQYSAEYGIGNELNMLDDISEEEYKYLEENLNIGEIL